METVLSSSPAINKKRITIGDRASGRDNNYDIMRFLAATMVIYYHAFPLGAGSSKGDFVSTITNGSWNSGALGVAIFFIISGFLITQSYENSKSIISFT